MNPNNPKKSPLELKAGQSSLKSFLKNKDDARIKSLKERYQSEETKKGSFMDRLKARPFVR
jgi:hypothetical protein